MKTALIIRHAAPETLAANFSGVLEQHGFQLESLNIFESAPAFDRFAPPPLEQVDLIVALGGPQSANDDFPAIHLERDYLCRALEIGTPVLGICLGAQIMATALGGTVEPTGGYQFGLRKLEVTATGDADPVFSKLTIPLVPTLHGECFSIPPGATRLAEGTMLCRDGSYRKINMAFRYGNAYGFQFEPQLTLEELQVWNRELGGDYALMGDRFDPNEEAARHLREFARYEPHYRAQMRSLLTAFLHNAGLI
ncbi:MAG: type 1 glutamine amidotransferase [Chloroflexi bacterium]|nr:type 1 glutamine amidotransferase [Chloroflexota bacterium]